MVGVAGSNPVVSTSLRNRFFKGMPKNAANSHYDRKFLPPRLIRLRLCVCAQRLKKAASAAFFVSAFFDDAVTAHRRHSHEGRNSEIVAVAMVATTVSGFQRLSG
jgi:hypothetical protein